MAGRKGSDKPAEQRYPFGPRPIAALLPACTRSAFRRRSPLAQRLLLDWQAVVGPVIAAIATPERLARGVLTLVCDGPAALELQHGAPALIERINTYFGRELVTRLALRQGVVPPPLLPSDRPRTHPPGPLLDAPPDLPDALADLPEGELRTALSRLAATLASESPPRRAK